MHRPRMLGLDWEYITNCILLVISNSYNRAPPLSVTKALPVYQLIHLFWLSFGVYFDSRYMAPSKMSEVLRALNTTQPSSQNLTYLNPNNNMLYNACIINIKSLQHNDTSPI